MGSQKVRVIQTVRDCFITIKLYRSNIHSNRAYEAYSLFLVMAHIVNHAQIVAKSVGIAHEN